MIGKPYPTGACAPSSIANGTQNVSWPENVLKLEGLQHQNLVENYEMWPARIQGNRPTCVAFAAAACIEWLRHQMAGRYEPLSPQFLYWHMRKLLDDNNTGAPPGWSAGATKLGQAMQVLGNLGICRWADCPYEDEDTGDGDPPTSEAEAAAHQNRIDLPDQIASSAIDDKRTFYRDWPSGDNRPRGGVAKMVYHLLEQKRPVAVALPVFYSTLSPRDTNWDNPTSTSSGEVEDPNPIDPPDGPNGPTEGWTRELKIPGMTEASPGHAVCIIGFDPDPLEPTGGWFRFRNSRGMVWASHGNQTPQRYAIPGTSRPRVVPARGYGSISATYIEHFCWELFSPVLV